MVTVPVPALMVAEVDESIDRVSVFNVMGALPELEIFPPPDPAVVKAIPKAGFVVDVLVPVMLMAPETEVTEPLLKISTPLLRSVDPPTLLLPPTPVMVTVPAPVAPRLAPFWIITPTLFRLFP